jgi:hypothetical protein
MPNPQPASRWPVLREIAHPRCVACCPENKFGLKLDFQDAGGGAVQATFDCSVAFEGYPGQLHGGIISTLLDSAMANCLFAQNLQGVTAERRTGRQAIVPAMPRSDRLTLLCQIRTEPARREEPWPRRTWTRSSTGCLRHVRRRGPTPSGCRRCGCIRSKARG